MKKISNVLFIILLMCSSATSDLSVNFSNQSVGIASGGDTPGDAVSVGSLMQLIWAATGSTLTTTNAYNIGAGQALAGEYILDEQFTINTFGFYGPNTGVYTDSDVDGVDINSGFFFLRAFDSASGVVGDKVRDFNAIDASQWVYNPVNTTTIFQDNLTGGSPGTFVDIASSGITIIEEPQSGNPTTNNLSSLTLVGNNSSALFIEDVDVINLTNIEAQGSDGLSVTSSLGEVAKGYDALELLKAWEIYITNTTQNISGGDGGTVTIDARGFNTSDVSGGNGLTLDFVSDSRILTTEGIRLNGGSGGLVNGRTGNILNANGGNALFANSGNIKLNGIFSGGSGGVVSLNSADLEFPLTTIVSANGAHAVDLNASTMILEPILAGSQFIGGDGGQKVNDGQIALSTNISANVNGGNGLNLRWNEVFDGGKSVIIEGGSFSGGDAGDASADQVNASGGYGLFVSGGHDLVITNATFTGGSGGEISALGDGFADGGSGAYIFGAGNGIVSADIASSTFTGGTGGSVNGVSAANGYGLQIEGSDVELFSDVNVLGGLFVNAGPYESSTVIYGGSYSDVHFTSLTNELYQSLGVNRGAFEIQGGAFGTISINGFEGHDGVITGGSIEDIVISGVSDHSLRFGGNATVGDIIFNNQGVNNLWLSNNVSLETSGNITVSDGIVNLNAWSSANIQNVILNDSAILRLNDQPSNMLHDNTFSLNSSNAQLEFNNNSITFEGGSTLDIGLGTVVGTDLVMASNSVTKIVLSANADPLNDYPAQGTLSATSTIELQEGAIVELINDGSYTKFAELEGEPGLPIATAGNIVSTLSVDDVYIVGNKPWLTGVIGINTNNTSIVFAEIGLLPLRRALEATGDLAIMADELQLLIDNNDEIAGLFRDGFPTQQAAISGITDSFFRTPEVANSLIGLQSVVQDQVAGRTRGYLKSNRFGKSAPSGPRGPDVAWWDRSMERINEGLPSLDLRGGLDALNESLPKVGFSFDNKNDQDKNYYKRFVNWLNEKVPSFKPSAPKFTSDYKSWGKAYYSDLAQNATDGFAGYEAQVVGGIAGMDRKTDSGIWGWAGGYADTVILGNFGQNADVDTIHGTIYFAGATQHAYLDASMSYAYSLVETIGPAGAGGYSSDYTASNLSFSVGAGVGLTVLKDQVQVTPEFLFLSSFYDQEAYTETSAVTGMPRKEFSAYDDWSHKVELGATFSLLQVLESTSMNLAIQPELRLHWLHDFNPSLEEQSYEFQGNTFSVALQAREENLLRTGLGLRFWDWTDHRTEFSLDFDAITGSDYEEITLSGSFIHRF